MFSITVFLGDTIPPVVLLFKGEDTQKVAIEAFEQVDSMVFAGGQIRRFTLEDDFGQRLTLHRPPFGVLQQDLKLAQLADIERAVHQAVTQAKAQERAHADPYLSQHFRKMQQGPAVLNPVGVPMNGRGF